MNTQRHAHGGFTLVELISAIAVSGILVLAAWLFTQAATRQHRMARQALDLVANAAVANATLQKELEAAGANTFSAYNWSGVQVSIAGPDSVAHDTLLVFRGVGPAYRNSVRGCISGATDCMVLVGALADSFPPGSLLVVGSPNTGARLVQVLGATSRTDLCGADCFHENATCIDDPHEDLVANVVTGSSLYDSTGVLKGTSSASCSQSYFENGDSCVETVVPQVVGSRMQIACTLGTSPTIALTEITFVDRTVTPFGYPELSTFTYQSGAAGFPLVVTQKVSFARYWLRAGVAKYPELVKQTELALDGSFGPALPVAADIETLRISVQHRDSTTIARGVRVSNSDLAFTINNPNYILTTAIAPDQTLPAHSFRRSYKTIALVQIEFTTVAQRKSGDDETRERVPHMLAVATPALLDGGVMPLYRNAP